MWLDYQMGQGSLSIGYLLSKMEAIHILSGS